MPEYSPEEIVYKLLDEALEKAKQGLIAKANKALVLLYDTCIEFPFFLWENDRILDLAKAFIVMYHFDTFDTESDNITVAHLAYFYAYRASQIAKEKGNESLLFESLKELTIITDTCKDCYIHTAAKYYQPKNRDCTPEEKHGSILLAGRVLPLVTYSFILEIEDTFHSFRDDEYIEDTCTKIESEYESISEKLTFEGAKIGAMCFNQILYKISKKDFLF